MFASFNDKCVSHLEEHILQLITKSCKCFLLVSSGDILTSLGEGALLALVGHPSSDGITIKMSYGIDVLHRPASHPIFSYWVG